MNNFLVADGCETNRVPVDHTHTSIYKSLVVEVDEGVDHSLTQVRIHSELCPVPVT